MFISESIKEAFEDVVFPERFERLKEFWLKVDFYLIWSNFQRRFFKKQYDYRLPWFYDEETLLDTSLCFSRLSSIQLQYKKGTPAELISKHFSKEALLMLKIYLFRLHNSQHFTPGQRSKLREISEVFERSGVEGEELETINEILKFE